jgi:tetratricopeptide (TPR) repeat protein
MFERVNPRLRVVSIVVVAALVAAGIAVGASLLTRSKPAPRPVARSGVPPLLLDLGVRSDPEAVALRRASALYTEGKRAQAKAIFDRYDSLEARIGSVFSAWPRDGLKALEAMGRSNPGSGLVELHLGLARFWSGYDSAAVAAWQAAKKVEPDTPSAIYADNFLHPSAPPGLPDFVPSFGPPAGLTGLAPARQLDLLARDARARDAHAKILYGVALQRLLRPVSAERQFAAAAALAPHDPDARVAAAVGLYDKDRPALAFSRLGPLVKVFPHAPTVRFHLALCLLWLGQVDKAKSELRLARAEGPASAIGREAALFLDRLATVKKR